MSKRTWQPQWTTNSRKVLSYVPDHRCFLAQSCTTTLNARKAPPLHVQWMHCQRLSPGCAYAGGQLLASPVAARGQSVSAHALHCPVSAAGKDFILAGIDRAACTPAKTCFNNHHQRSGLYP